MGCSCELIRLNTIAVEATSSSTAASAPTLRQASRRRFLRAARVLEIGVLSRCCVPLCRSGLGLIRQTRQHALHQRCARHGRPHTVSRRPRQRPNALRLSQCALAIGAGIQVALNRAALVAREFVGCPGRQQFIGEMRRCAVLLLSQDIRSSLCLGFQCGVRSAQGR